MTNILAGVEAKNSYKHIYALHIQDARNIEQDARSLAQDARNQAQDAWTVAQPNPKNVLFIKLLADFSDYITG